jgi:hypothetical protein
MVDRPSEVVVLQDEKRESFDGIEEGIELPLAVDDISALKPLLRKNPL